MKENVGVFEGGALESSCRDSSLVAVAVAVADGAMVWGLGGWVLAVSADRCDMRLLLPGSHDRQLGAAAAVKSRGSWESRGWVCCFLELVC